MACAEDRLLLPSHCSKTAGEDSFLCTFLSASTVREEARKALPPNTHTIAVVNKANSVLMALPAYSV